MSDDDKEEGLFKSLKNIENVQKGLIGGDDRDKDKKNQQSNNNIDTKPPNVFNYFESFSQETKDLMDEIKDAVDEIDAKNLLFIGSNWKKFNFNFLRMPINFLLAFYNGDISLKEAKFLQKDLYDQINQLKFDYRPENAEEKEEIDKVLMHANVMLEYRDKIIEAFTNGTFSSEHLKESDNAAYDYVLEDVNNFIQKIESMAEEINLSLFNEFFELSPVDYARMLINPKNPNEN